MIEKDKLVIPFEINWREKKIEARLFLTIRYGTYEDDYLEKSLEISDGEDLEHYIRSITRGSYDEVFEDYEMVNGISYVEFVGVEVIGKNDKGSMMYHLKDHHKQARISVADGVTKDINLEKMQRILEILKE